MAVYLNKNGRDLTVAIDAKDGEVHISHQGYVFAKLRTNDDGEHLIEVFDRDASDYGKKADYSKPIWLLCSSR